MSVQFGKCNFDGRPVDPEDLDRVGTLLAPYGPDGERRLCKQNFGVLYRAFHTTEESWRELQPCEFACEVVLTWDGRLDTRGDLLSLLAGKLAATATDVEIAAAAFERWGTNSFAKLIGDWALSVWDARSQTLILAKDFIGARHLFYSRERDEVTWCTILDPLVLLSNRHFELDKEYLAGWLAFFPSPCLTPYVGIASVPPSSFVQIARDQKVVREYWSFDSARSIVYRDDREYEEHFRSVFSDSVHRRLRSDRTVIAELSGGVDSSSIVCIADHIVDRGFVQASKIATLSYYDVSEPNWNELPYVAVVEQRRGVTGCHIDVSQRTYTPQSAERPFPVLPGSASYCDEPERRFADCLAEQGHRVLLSGLGGDEVMGGVPTPIPELQDFLVNFRFRALAHQLKAWALVQRRPWLFLLRETLREFLPPNWRCIGSDRTSVYWLCPNFEQKYRMALSGYEPRMKFLGPRPCFQQNLTTVDALRRHVAVTAPSSNPPHEKRYPYLDRDLLEFVFAVPRDQLIRPGRRRSLQRRALHGIVPPEILERKRKAYVTHGPTAAVAAHCRELTAGGMIAASLGILDPHLFADALDQARKGKEVPVVSLLRTLTIESWLRAVVTSGQSQCNGQPQWADLSRVTT